MKRKLNVVAYLLIAAILVLVSLPAASAVSETQIDQAIYNGTAWLAAQQNPEDGSWGDVARTAFAVKKLEHYCMDPKYGLGLPSWQDPACPYKDAILRGFNYTFKNARIISISNQTHDGRLDNPDTNGNGTGVYFGNRRTYETGIALMAIAESNAQDKRVCVSDSEVYNWTYHDVAVDAMDYLAYGQNDANWERGGWGYSENTVGWSDNSNTGYAVLGLQYAQAPKAPKPEGFGLTIPPFVKTELNIWIDYIQCKPGDSGYTNDTCGGSGYSSPCYWVNILKTGNLLKEMAFVGNTTEDERVKEAINYTVRVWNDTADPGWRPNHYQAMYTTMKGLTAFNIQRINGIDWQADFDQAIVDQQNPDGSWSGCPYYCSGKSCYTADNILCTEWALLTLQKVVPTPVMIGNVTGGGWIPISVAAPSKGKPPKEGKATFGFVAHYVNGATTPSGNLQYTDHVSGMSVHGNVTTLSVDKKTMTATFSGIAKVDGVDGYAYTVKVVDNGEPGKNDIFGINIPAKSYAANGTLGGGNIQIHDP